MSSSGTQLPQGHGAFVSTRWSLVISAGNSCDPEACRALENLCEHYWFPIYVFVRRRGFDVDEAQDMTQGFFARLLEKRDFVSATPERGRFRTFLLGAVQHYLSNERDKAHAQKRGGGCELLPLDFHDAEIRYGREPFHEETPEKAYERRWVLTLLENVLGRLREEMKDEGRLELYERLKPFLTPSGCDLPYRTLARELDMSESAVKVAVHRLRRRYGDLLREVISHTLEDPQHVREEINFLLDALGS